MCKKLQRQIELRLKQLPVLFNYNRYQIKFPRESLEEIKAMAMKIIKGLERDMNLNAFVWKRNDVPVGKYKLLVSRLLQTVLGSSAVESTEDTDNRIELVAEENGLKKKLAVIEKVVKGRVDLKIYSAKFLEK